MLWNSLNARPDIIMNESNLLIFPGHAFLSLFVQGQLIHFILSWKDSREKTRKLLPTFWKWKLYKFCSEHLLWKCMLPVHQSSAYKLQTPTNSWVLKLISKDSRHAEFAVRIILHLGKVNYECLNFYFNIFPTTVKLWACLLASVHFSNIVEGEW